MRRRKGSSARVRAQDRVLSWAPTPGESALTSGYLLVEARSPLPGAPREQQAAVMCLPLAHDLHWPTADCESAVTSVRPGPEAVTDDDAHNVSLTQPGGHAFGSHDDGDTSARVIAASELMISIRPSGVAVWSMLDRMSGEKTPVDRFNGAWRRFERCLNGLYPPDRREGGDSEAQIRRAMADGVVTREQGGFLEACRRVRNAFTHVSFDEYDGPAAAPPQPVVVRLERLVRELVDRVRLKEVTKPALTCRADDQLQDVLREMKEHDYTQVPYQLEGTGWVLLTRDQVARWVEDSAQENLVMVDLHTTVGELSEAVGPVVPTVLAADSYLVDALAHLEWSEGEAYPAVIVDRGQGKPPGVLTAWDIPELYRRLGR